MILCSQDAVKLVVEFGKASTSLLNTSAAAFGYGRAAHLIGSDGTRTESWARPMVPSARSVEASRLDFRDRGDHGARVRVPREQPNRDLPSPHSGLFFDSFAANSAILPRFPMSDRRPPMFSLKRAPVIPSYRSFFFFCACSVPACTRREISGPRTVTRIGRRTKRAKCWKIRRGLRRSPYDRFKAP